eukprot:TRINITY_DN13037_c0_g1_i1.p1 TRINITY_DN13037_c0_g1~~TRINITY_DN13037_c0_g1_i1.p1  ORF type:complete len:391 (-),score=22.58 TRINITY_DN13037_c0_g1_i1:216-1319(-)
MFGLLLNSKQAFFQPVTYRHKQVVCNNASVEAASSTRITEMLPKETIRLGKSKLEVSNIGVGAWSWGDRSGYWGYGSDYTKNDNLNAYVSVLESGINFIDTAEVYGFGQSEEFLKDFMTQTNTSPIIATKFAPLPWRYTEDSVVSALRSSLIRLGLSSVGLYMIHWPGFFLNMFSNDEYVKGLAKCVDLGLAEAVGVSNFNAQRVLASHKILQERGVVLASNQVQYSLLYRTPEKNGVLESCNEVGVTLVAYSPLCQGLLTGKYKPGNGPSGQRKLTYSDEQLRQIEPLIQLMREIGEQHGGKTPAQVALNWCVCKGVLPIPGVKNRRQVEETAGAFGWRLTKQEQMDLEKASDKIPTSVGAPFENW